MKKLLHIALALGLALAFPAAAAAAQAPAYESEKGQAVIGPPASEKTTDQKEKDAASVTDWAAANDAASPASGEGNFTVVVDAGHQGPIVDMSAPETMAPGSSQTKPRATSGTQGNLSGVPEYEVNLQVSLLLQKELEKRGYRVVMTRTDNDTAISNKERAELATTENADITVRIHCNSDNSASAAGALTMAPTSANQYLSAEVIEKSNTLAACIINHYSTATGLANRGVISSDNMTGTNWSTVPVAILEMGFMSNQSDDAYLADSANYPVMVSGIADGIDEYFSIVAPESSAVGTHMSDLTDRLEKDYLNGKEAAGEAWAAAVMDLSTDDYSTVHADKTMQSAGLIKGFIMGAVYEKLVFPDNSKQPSTDYEKTLKPLLTNMITANDDLAAADLVKRLGGGDFSAGAKVVDQFCKDHGYSSTHLGREFQASNDKDDNYTSASDCCRLLSEIYKKTLINETACTEMLVILKGQTEKGKLPAGLPQGVESGNMAGFVTAEQKTGMIENDMAIVLDGAHPYVICVLANDIKANAEAQKTITEISKTVYQYMTAEQPAADGNNK